MEGLSIGAELENDLRSLASTGGRLIGSSSEAEATRMLRERLAAIPGVRPIEHAFDYSAWRNVRSEVRVLSPASQTLRAHALYWSAETLPDGLLAEVVDVGRGTQEEFDRLSTQIKGRAVLVRHEFPFSSTTIHRRLKYNWSREHGAAAFLIANNQPGEYLVTGSCGQDATDNIPGFGVSLESGDLLARTKGARVLLRQENERFPTVGTNLVAEIPGHTSEWVIVCAHYDGHDLAESALDNATGVASALAVLRAFAPHVRNLRRGLRVVLFTAEESGLLGSRRYVDDLGEDDKRSIALVINLDTTVGSDKMSCLVSGFSDVQRFVQSSAEQARHQIDCVLPLLRNSDHFSFASHGIPAVRLVAGFDDPESGARFILTEEDRLDKISSAQLRRGVQLAGSLVWDALTQPTCIAEHQVPHRSHSI